MNFWDVGSIHGDEYYTRREDAEIIADHILSIPLKVWCPFNDTESVWVSVLKERGFEVVTTDTVFFETDPPGGGTSYYKQSTIHKKSRGYGTYKGIEFEVCIDTPLSMA